MELRSTKLSALSTCPPTGKHRLAYDWRPLFTLPGGESMSRNHRRRNESSRSGAAAAPQTGSTPDNSPKSRLNWLPNLTTASATLFAGIAVVISCQQLKLSQEAFETGTRAYIGLKDGSIEGDIRVGERPLFIVTLENAGNSPALDVSTEISLAHLEGTLEPSKVPSSRLPMRFPASKSPILPRGIVLMELTYDHALTQDEVSAIASGSRRIAVVGFAKYMDIFGKSHRTDFCVFPPSIDSHGLRACEQLNHLE